MYKIHETSGIIHESTPFDYKQSIINGIKIATVAIGTVALVMLVSGCASKRMQPTIAELTEKYSHAVTVTAQSRDAGMAISKAQFEGRIQLAKRLQTTTLVGSRVIRQDLQRDESGILYIATVTMAIP